MEFVLDFFVAGWSVVDDPPAGRFLGLDDEADSETAVGSAVLCREGLGGKAWSKIGSTPTPCISYV